MRKLLPLLACAFVHSACGDGGGAPDDAARDDAAPLDAGADAPVGDVDPPVVTLISPAPGAVAHTATITLEGTATDASAITRIAVGGVDATTTDGFATFSVTVPIVLGDNVLHVLARDGAGNEDAEAASITVVGEDDTDPAITGIYPPSFAGVEGPTTVIVEASDAFGIATVTVGGTPATKDARGLYVVEDVPVDTTHTIVVTDAAGRTTSVDHTLAAPQLFVSSLSRLTEEPGGTMLGVDWAHSAIVRLDPFGATRHVYVSGALRGEGPAIESAGVLGLDVVGDDVHLATTSNEGVDVVAIDRVTGDRSLSRQCTLAGSPTAAVTVGAPLRTYVVLDDGAVHACAADGPSTLVATLDFARAFVWVTELRFDATANRLIVAEANRGEVIALDLDDASTHTLRADGASSEDGARGVATLEGEVFIATYGGQLLELAPGGAPTQLSDAAPRNPLSLSPCRNNATRALCVQGMSMSRFVDAGAAWTATVLDVTAKVGAGGDLGGFGPTTVLPRPEARANDFVFVQGTNDLTRIDGVTGARTVVLASPDLPLVRRMTPIPGTRRSLVWSIFDTLSILDPDAEPPSVTPLDGPDTTRLSAFAGLPAGTRRVDASVVYATSDDPNAVRLRDLTSGVDEELARFDAQVSSIATALDGRVFVVTYQKVHVIAAGSSTPALLAEHVDAYPLVFDDRTDVLFGGLALIHASTGAVTHLPFEAFSPLDGCQHASPGPYPGSLLCSSGWVGALALVDLPTRSVWLLAR